METIISRDKYRVITTDNIVVRKKVYDWLYILDEVNITYMYLIIGKEKALLYDTGYGFTDFRHLITEVTDLPLTVVCSHGHDDHTLGCRLFDEVYLNEADLDLCMSNDNPVQKGKQILACLPDAPDLDKIIDKDVYCNTTLANCTFKNVKEGDVFDLGGITLEVYNIPGHTKGGIALYCPEKKALFPGDAMALNHDLIYAQSLSISAPPQYMIRALTKLEKLDIDEIWCAHGDVPADKSLLTGTRDLMIDFAKNADYEKEKQEPPKNRIFGNPDDPPSGKHVYNGMAVGYHPGHLEQVREYMAENDGAVE